MLLRSTMSKAFFWGMLRRLFILFLIMFCSFRQDEETWKIYAKQHDVDSSVINDLFKELASMLETNRYHDILGVMEEVEGLLTSLGQSSPSPISNQQFGSFLLLKGQALVKLNRVEEAKAVLKSSLKMHPFEKKTWMEWSNLHVAMGEYGGALSGFNTLYTKFKDFSSISGFQQIKGELGYYNQWERDLFTLRRFLDRSCRNTDSSEQTNSENVEEDMYLKPCSISSVDSLEYSDIDSLLEYSNLLGRGNKNFGDEGPLVHAEEINKSRRHQLLLQSLKQSLDGKLHGHKRQRLRLGFIVDLSSTSSLFPNEENNRKNADLEEEEKKKNDQQRGKGLQIGQSNTNDKDKDSRKKTKEEDLICQVISNFDLNSDNDPIEIESATGGHELAFPSPTFEFFYFPIRIRSNVSSELRDTREDNVEFRQYERRCDPNESNNTESVLHTSTVNVIEVSLPKRDAVDILSIDQLTEELVNKNLDILIDLSVKGSMPTTCWFTPSNQSYDGMRGCRSTSLIEKLLSYRIALLQLSFQDHSMTSLSLPNTVIDYVLTDRILTGIATGSSILNDKHIHNEVALLPSSAMIPFSLASLNQKMRDKIGIVEEMKEPGLDKYHLLSSLMKISELDPTMLTLFCNILRSVPNTRLLLDQIPKADFGDIDAMAATAGILSYRWVGKKTKKDVGQEEDALRKKVLLLLEPLVEHKDKRYDDIAWSATIPKITLSAGKLVKSRTAESRLYEPSISTLDSELLSSPSVSDELGLVYSLKEYEDLAIAAIRGKTLPKGKRKGLRQTFRLDPLIHVWKKVKEIELKASSDPLRSLKAWSQDLQRMVESVWEISILTLSQPSITEKYHIVGTSSWKFIQNSAPKAMIRSMGSLESGGNDTTADEVNSDVESEDSNTDETITHNSSEHKIPIPEYVFQKDILMLKIGGAFDVPGWINMYSQEYLDHYQPLYNLHVDVLRAHNDLSDFPNNSVSGLYITYDGFSYMKTSEYVHSMQEWFRVLRPGGMLFLALMDNSVLSRLYIDPSMSFQEKMDISMLIYGSQDHDLTIKKNGFDQEVLLYFLFKNKFCLVNRVKSFEVMSLPDIPESFYKGYITSMYIHASVCPKTKPDVPYDDFGLVLDGTNYRGYREEDYEEL